MGDKALLDRIKSPHDLRQLAENELIQLSKELRQEKRCWSLRLRSAGGIQYLVCGAAYAYLATLA